MLLSAFFNRMGSHHIYDPNFSFSMEGEARTCFREASGGGAADASVPDEVSDFFPMCFGSC